jgi:hypothetical protein
VIMVRRRSRWPRATDNGSSERIRHASGAALRIARAMNVMPHVACHNGPASRGAWFQGLV